MTEARTEPGAHRAAGAADRAGAADPAGTVDAREAEQSRPAPAEQAGPMLGGTVLLRVAGVPCGEWTDAADPALFARVRLEAAATARLAARARELSEWLGTSVVPHPLLPASERRTVLALRRRLHAGAAPDPADCRFLDTSPVVPSDLADQARALAYEAESGAVAQGQLERAVAAEHLRVAARGWELARTSPVLRSFLADASPDLTADIERRLAAGESWSDKRLRKRAAYLWRAVGRAAAKTTPRGWAGQLVALPLVPAGAGPQDRAAVLFAPGTPLGALAAGAMENLHLARTRPQRPDLRQADPGTLLVPAPLHFTEPPTGPDDPGRLRCYVVEARDPGRLRQVVLRRTRALEMVLAALADGPRSLGEVECALAGRAAPSDTAPLRAFLHHLLTRGVLQVCAAPRPRYSPWTPAEEVAAGARPLPWPAAPPHPTVASAHSTAAPPHPAGGSARPAGPDDDRAGWYLDSYRRTTATLPARAADRVERGLRIAARIAALREQDGGPARRGPGLPGLTDTPRPLSELLAGELATTEGDPPAPVRRARYAGWPGPRQSGSPYARLLARLAAHSGEGEIDVDDALLDELGAPPAGDALPPWPMDCLLRPLPGPGPVAVLETASSAGVLDARFADGLRALYGRYPNADAYRAFLAAVERRTGVRFVELLLPPMAEQAANAVRRPVTTGWWTGDPDPAPYYGPRATQARYLPLDRITLRRDGDRVLAEADGQRVIPVHHATRSPVPPYDVLVRILMSAGHPLTHQLIRLDGLDAALPGHTRLPRVTAGGDLVLLPATWRIDRARLWRAGDACLGKVRVLALLRRSAGLPRHAFVRAAAEVKPVPVDFDSVTTVQLLERLCARHEGPDLLVEEMLPAPGDLVLSDPLHHGAAVAAQALLRLPYQRGADELAARAAVALRGGTPDVPGLPASRGEIAGAVITH